MRKSETHGTICLDGPEGLVYRICTLDYTVWENDEFEYRFRPNYRVVELLGPPEFEGIPGIDLSLRREEYVRRNRIPVFISERAPAPNREDLWKHLDDVGLDHLNQLEWLIRTDTRYIGDGLYVERALNPCDINLLSIENTVLCAQNTEIAMRMILRALAGGQDIELDGKPLDDLARRPLHYTLLPLLEKGRAYRESMRERAASERGAIGRKRLAIDGVKLESLIERYERHEVTAKEAAEKLGIGEATFYRRLKEWRLRQDPEP